MEERQVTAEGRSLALPDPFVVVATQNPVEQEGTYPLPEAQLDRFLSKLLVGYPATTRRSTSSSATTGVGSTRPGCRRVTRVAGAAEPGGSTTKRRTGDRGGRCSTTWSRLPGHPRVALDRARRVTPRERPPSCTRRRVYLVVGALVAVTPDEVKAVAKPAPATGSRCDPRSSSTA
ncbi:MAG: AAA family ATPase [Microthrixaceae bacterium]